MNIEKQLEYLSKSWMIFPTFSFYPTTYDTSLIVNEEHMVYVYVVHRVTNPLFEEVQIQSSFFRLFEFKYQGIGKSLGYCIIPKLSESFKLRYTPCFLTVVNKLAKKEIIEKSNRELIYENEYFDIFKIPECNVEFVTDIGPKFGIFLGAGEIKK